MQHYIDDHFPCTELRWNAISRDHSRSFTPKNSRPWQGRFLTLNTRFNLALCLSHSQHSHVRIHKANVHLQKRALQIISQFRAIAILCVIVAAAGLIGLGHQRSSRSFTPLGFDRFNYINRYTYQNRFALWLFRITERRCKMAQDR